MHDLLVIDPLLVLHEVISQTSEGQVLHDQTEIASAFVKRKGAKIATLSNNLFHQ